MHGPQEAHGEKLPGGTVIEQQLDENGFKEVVWYSHGSEIAMSTFYKFGVPEKESYHYQRQEVSRAVYARHRKKYPDMPPPTRGVGDCAQSYAFDEQRRDGSGTRGYQLAAGGEPRAIVRAVLDRRPGARGAVTVPLPTGRL